MSAMTFGKIGTKPLFKHWTARDYVQNGLVAMWDGIENAGWGVHDMNATTCKDVIGGLEIPITVKDENTFRTTSTTFFSTINLSGDMTIKWVASPQFEFIEGFYSRLLNANPLRYQVGGIRAGYPVYQIRYWNGTNQLSKYPMLKSILSGVIKYSNGVFEVWGDGTLKASYTDAVAPQEDTGFGIFANANLCNIGVYTRALTASEIVANYIVDRARFNLP